MNQRKIFIATACLGCFSLLNASSIFEEQKINVYNVPHNQVNDLDYNKLEKYTSETPLYAVKQNVSTGKTMMKTKDGKVVVVADKNRNPIQNYNDLLMIAKQYADENIPLADLKRLEKALNLAKLESSIDEKKYNEHDNSNLIVSIKQKKSGTINNAFDYSDLNLMDSLDYFINNYSKINKEQTSDITKDTRYQLIVNIKEKIKPYTNIDASHIDYSINLEELKVLKVTLLNNMN